MSSGFLCLVSAVYTAPCTTWWWKSDGLIKVQDFNQMKVIFYAIMWHIHKTVHHVLYYGQNPKCSRLTLAATSCETFLSFFVAVFFSCFFPTRLSKILLINMEFPSWKWHNQDSRQLNYKKVEFTVLCRFSNVFLKRVFAPKHIFL